jgi:hypothetical protein
VDEYFGGILAEQRRERERRRRTIDLPMRSRERPSALCSTPAIYFPHPV